MNYDCPNPICAASWILTEKPFLGGSTFTCGDCKTTSRIPLYCPTCCPPSLATKNWLETPKGFLGGKEFVCPKGHCFRVLLSREDTHQRLGELGAEIGQYHQGERIDAMKDASLKQAVSGGYCAGAVLDWLRRALLGGKPTFTDAEHLLKANLEPGKADYALREKEFRQDKRGATAWIESSPPKITAQNARKQALLQQQQNEYDTQWEAGKRKFHECWDAIKKQPGRTQEDKNDALAELQEKYNQLEAKLSAKNAQNQQQFQAFAAQPIMARFWEEFSEVMDKFIAQDRQARHLNKPTSRPFRNLKVAHSRDSTPFKGVAALLDALFAEREFRPNCGAYIGVNPPTGGTGHAVGVHRLNTGGRYHFFDPNYGIYEFDLKGLREAVIFLFTAAYPYSMGGSSDNHPYEVNGQTKGHYTIFEGRNSIPATVQELPPQPATKRLTISLQPLKTEPAFEPVPQRGKQPEAKPNPTPTNKVKGSHVAALMQNWEK